MIERTLFVTFYGKNIKMGKGRKLEECFISSLQPFSSFLWQL
jgi:hypothetical protein